MLMIFSSPLLYADFIRLPKFSDPIPEYILNDPKIFPFFSLKMPLAPLTAPISMHLLPLTKMPCMITMVPSQPMPWPFVIFLCSFSMSRAAGKGLLLMPKCFMIPTLPISVFLRGNTSLWMQGSPPALPFLFHIMMHNITFLNGAALNYSIVPPLLE